VDGFVVTLSGCGNAPHACANSVDGREQCLYASGSEESANGAWRELTQRWSAPGEIVSADISFARSADQLDSGWSLSFFVDFADERVLVDEVTHLSSDSRTVRKGGVEPSHSQHEVAFTIRLDRTGSELRHSFVWVDDVVLDVCWR